jgi:hypothetical protein
MHQSTAETPDATASDAAEPLIDLSSGRIASLISIPVVSIVILQDLRPLAESFGKIIV